MNLDESKGRPDPVDLAASLTAEQERDLAERVARRKLDRKLRRMFLDQARGPLGRLSRQIDRTFRRLEEVDRRGR